jgi:hypothetical protein
MTATTVSRARIPPHFCLTLTNEHFNTAPSTAYIVYGFKWVPKSRLELTWTTWLDLNQKSWVEVKSMCDLSWLSKSKLDFSSHGNITAACSLETIWRENDDIDIEEPGHKLADAKTRWRDTWYHRTFWQISADVWEVQTLFQPIREPEKALTPKLLMKTGVYCKKLKLGSLRPVPNGSRNKI